MSPAIKIAGAAAAVLLLLVACVRADDVTWTQCVANELRELSPGALDNNATEIYLYSCTITRLNVDDLKGLPNLSKVLLWNNTIRHIDPSMFRTVPLVSLLDLDINELDAMPVFGEYSVLPNLEILHVNFNKITKLDDPKTFSSTRMLTRISLKYNDIEYIHPDVFSGLSNLTKIDLDNNKLTYVPDRMFSLSSLQRLYLANNSIEFVAAGAFEGSPLKKLYLEGNRLTHLPENFFTGAIASLKSFCFHLNPWRCDYLEDISVVNMKCITKPSGAELECFSEGAIRKFDYNNLN